MLQHNGEALLLTVVRTVSLQQSWQGAGRTGTPGQIAGENVDV